MVTNTEELAGEIVWCIVEATPCSVHNLDSRHENKQSKNISLNGIIGKELFCYLTIVTYRMCMHIYVTV